jgi:hypothetical protein
MSVDVFDNRRQINEWFVVKSECGGRKRVSVGSPDGRNEGIEGVGAPTAKKKKLGLSEGLVRVSGTSAIRMSREERNNERASVCACGPDRQTDHRTAGQKPWKLMECI